MQAEAATEGERTARLVLRSRAMPLNHPRRQMTVSRVLTSTSKKELMTWPLLVQKTQEQKPSLSFFSSALLNAMRAT